MAFIENPKIIPEANSALIPAHPYRAIPQSEESASLSASHIAAFSISAAGCRRDERDVVIRERLPTLRRCFSPYVFLSQSVVEVSVNVHRLQKAASEPQAPETTRKFNQKIAGRSSLPFEKALSPIDSDHKNKHARTNQNTSNCVNVNVGFYEKSNPAKLMDPYFENDPDCHSPSTNVSTSVNPAST